MQGFTGQITMFAGNYAPRNWALCHGQLLPIVNHSALFSLIGNFYGGDGRMTFAVPDLRGRLPLGVNTDTGRTPRPLGAFLGTEAVALQQHELPPHNHNFRVSTNSATSPFPDGNVFASTNMYASPEAKQTGPSAMYDGIVEYTGRGEAHNNMMPSTAVNFIICLTGIYPSRN